MEEHSNLVLVTWDFTDKSVFALEHAINLAKVINHDIALINIVKNQPTPYLHEILRRPTSSFPLFPGNQQELGP